MKTMSKFFVCCAVFLLAFAQKLVATNIVDGVLADASEVMTGAVSAALPILVSVIIAVLGIWLIPKAIRWVKSAVGR